ncbi:Hypothetical protein MVR_LOCUS171 [uncultured virus]|nr:Hypothetical protein MVR_LOCUS171 [uncultured virus]
MHNFVVDGVSMPMVHRPNYYMWDTEFMKSADMAVVNLLADPKPRNSFAETDTLCIHPDVLTTLYQLCADVAVHPVFLITFAELLDYVWHRINSSPNRTELIKTFNDFMARARNLDVEHLFRYTIYSIAKPFDDLVIIYSEASNLDRFIRDIECEDATDSMSMICYKVFQAAAVLNQTYDTALALVCSLAEHIYSYSNPLLDSRAEHMLILYSYTELTYNSLKRTYNSLKRTNY